MMECFGPGHRRKCPGETVIATLEVAGRATDTGALRTDGGMYRTKEEATSSVVLVGEDGFR